MTLKRQLQFWIVGFVVFLAAVYVFRGIMLPFVAGMAVAYFCDPIADRLERLGASRTVAVSLIIGLFLVVFIAFFLLMVPLVIDQIGGLARRMPSIVAWLRDWAEPYLARLAPHVGTEDLEKLRQMALNSLSTGLRWIGQVLRELITQGAALADFVSLLVITPIVAFYLLRDWDLMVEAVDGWLPRQHRAEIRRLATEVDRTLSGFVRGQATVCVLLGVFYALALTVVGLEFGLVIGLIAGLVSFIPFVGSLVGFVASVGVAIYQFGHLQNDWTTVGIVAGIFAVGQAVEGNYLTPKLVGEQVGLHAVWVIFALLAGGALFGFTGVLLAMPVAAMIGVLTRFALEQYLSSPLYTGPPGQEWTGDALPPRTGDESGDRPKSGGDGA